MLPGSEEPLEDDFVLRKRKKEIVKEEILDETYKKAEFLKKTQPVKEKRKGGDKPFFKSGIIIMIIAIVALALINYTPWMYAKYDSGDSTFQQFFYKDFVTKDMENQTYNNITNLFDSPCQNCTNNSNYIGLAKEDFTNTPKLTSYGFIALLLMGLIFTIFVVIDWLRKFSFEKTYLVSSIFAVGYILVSVFILLLSLKFVSANFLLLYNMPFIQDEIGLTNVFLIFLAPIIMIVFSCAIMKGSMTVLKINYREVEKGLEPEETKKAHSTFRYGGAQI